MPLMPMYLADRIATDAKKLAKSIYRKPAIEAARLYRPMLNGARIVGVTGSSGKTTTKDLAHTVLSSRFRTHKSSDTNNTLYSVARTLLQTPRHTEVCVQELGASQSDDLNESVRLLGPSVGVVTNIGHEHYRADRAAAEKAKLVRGLPQDGVAILNADDDRVLDMATQANCRVITFGRSAKAMLRATDIRAEWPGRLEATISYQADRVTCRTQLVGEHFVYCVLAAVAAGLACGMTLREAVKSVSDFAPVPGRMMPVTTPSGATLIRDDWKAPFWSIEAGIAFLRLARAHRKLAIFGTLSDYSGTSRTKYVHVSRAALEVADHVIFVGPNAHKGLRVGEIPDGKTLEAFSTVKELAARMQELLAPGDLVLLKGSGGDHLARLALMYERDVKCWRERCGRVRLCDNCGLLSLREQRAAA